MENVLKVNLAYVALFAIMALVFIPAQKDMNL